MPKPEPQSLLKISSNTKADLESSNQQVNIYLQEFIRNQQITNVKLSNSCVMKFSEDVESCSSKTKKNSSKIEMNSSTKEDIYTTTFYNAKKSTPSSVNY